MSPKKKSELVIQAVHNFIVQKYSFHLPNSLLVAQEFILENPHYGREFGLMEINKIIEESIKNKGV